MDTNKIRVEYIWLDGNNPQKLRSKTRVLHLNSYTQELDINSVQLPEWTYDGSSTNQAVTEDSEIILKPRTKFKSPLEGSDILVMCDTYYSNGKPEKNNHRHFLSNVVNEKDQETWYGFEQEYFMVDRITKRPIGWPEGQDSFPKAQGDYYCGVGVNHVKGREIANLHLDLCLQAGLNVSGINAEVALGQWEYQLGPVTSLEGSDQMWVSRYILYRVGEIYDVEMNIDPKPIKGSDWNGSGMHVNFSTGEMRDPENIKSGKTIELIEEACQKLEKTHKEHMSVYGVGNKDRATGENETASYEKFTWDHGSRSSSIRIPVGVNRKEVGYLEDRRPGSNADPYLVVKKLIETIC